MWPIYALMASVLWGISYAVIGNLLKVVSVQSVVLFELGMGVLAFAILACFGTTIRTDFHNIIANPVLMWQFILAAVVFNLANFLIVFSVRESNAVVVSLLEITYPLFVVLFSWLFFKEAHMSVRTALGGAMIMAGVVMIYWKGK